MKLADKLENHFRLDESTKKALARLGLFSVADLLFYFPVRYSDISQVKKIIDLAPGETATVFGKVSGLKTKKAWKSKIPMAEGYIEDMSGKIKIIWFNQAYLAKMLKNGEVVKMTGRVTESKSGTYLANPEFERTAGSAIDVHDSLFDTGGGATGLSYPVYHESRGISSKFIYHAIEKILKDKTLDEVEDYIPKEILNKYNLPSIGTALVWIHRPRKESDAVAARKRFAFEEVFVIQLGRQMDKHEYSKYKSFKINEANVNEFLGRFPFQPTESQTKSIETILSDMKRNQPMSRLLEGDVGSGKTLVAAAAAFATVSTRPNNQSFGNLQVAYMTPTEILATQQFESFIKYFEYLGINVGLLTGSGCRKFPSKINPKSWTDISRAQLLKWVANGEVPILIGTHALIQKTVKFKNLALVVIDEQHRFGTAQRRKLVRKDNVAPHLLSMTATPIPRTLALTIYGDLDLSLIAEMPSGRKPIITEIVTPDKRDATYEKIKSELESGRQLYVICPRIADDEESGIEMKSVTTEAKRLKKEVFPKGTIGILHSKMSKQKKEEVMEQFAKHEIDILVATSVVEVGVNVPNATNIIIEGAERFGLAQLHQLRGRVVRSNHQAYCYVFASAKTEKTMSRLKALQTAKNGFELSELDLALRGAGELGGTKQWGISDLGMEAIKNIKMVEAARTEATRIIAEDPELKNYQLLKTRVEQKNTDFHFE
ncbi:MAG: ATP-dependent DNA helicase RecG [Candidatus Pacebacteria bacterium]|nr:ATP-dependent DNA helicase RecG [Candidatus Paceibacterota bacterium]MBP9851610.1 ATP-dependent DNA helicase RecG [Candidatus Paceibacterota bacterium]